MPGAAPNEQIPPVDVDLRDFAFMPLYIERLQKSKAWLRCKRSPELAFYMLNLWMRAWHEVPAGTIEDDDDVLADAAMCDPSKWEKLKARVMVGWTKEGGRWTHPVVSEIAAESWSGKVDHRRRKEEDRIRKRLERERKDGGLPMDVQAVSAGHPAEADKSYGGNPAENALKGQGQGQGQGQKKANLRLSSTPPSASAGLRSEIVKAFASAGSATIPDTSRADVWLSQGLDPVICVAVIRECLARKSEIKGLTYFEKPILEAHEKRRSNGHAVSDPETFSEKVYQLPGGLETSASRLVKVIQHYRNDPRLCLPLWGDEAEMRAKTPTELAHLWNAPDIAGASK